MTVICFLSDLCLQQLTFAVFQCPEKCLIMSMVRVQNDVYFVFRNFATVFQRPRSRLLLFRSKFDFAFYCGYGQLRLLRYSQTFLQNPVATDASALFLCRCVFICVSSVSNTVLVFRLLNLSTYNIRHDCTGMCLLKIKIAGCHKPCCVIIRSLCFVQLGIIEICILKK